MALDLEEQEQLEELKAWWRKHGMMVLAGVGIFVTGVVGWKGWQTWTTTESAESMMQFERAMQAAMSNDAKTVKDVTGQLMERSLFMGVGRSGYAVPAAWLAGKTNYSAGDLQSAEAQYQFALQHADDKGLEQLARLRLAAIKLDRKDYDGALKLLAVTPEPGFAGLFADLKGDVLAIQNKPAEARVAYQLALDKFDAKSPLKAMIEAKLDSLGG